MTNVVSYDKINRRPTQTDTDKLTRNIPTCRELLNRLTNDHRPMIDDEYIRVQPSRLQKNGQFAIEKSDSFFQQAETRNLQPATRNPNRPHCCSDLAGFPFRL